MARLLVMNAETVLAGILVAVIVAAAISAMGSWTGPALFALAFMALGALCLFGGGGQGFWVVAGLAFLGAGVIELGAVSAFWDARTTSPGPSGAWRTTAVLVGIGGSVGFFVVLMIAAIAAVSLYSQL